MKKANKPFKIIVDTNIWISFLIGKSLTGLQNYIDTKKVLIVTCTEQIQELAEVFQKTKIKRYFTSEQVIEFFELLNESSVYVELKIKTNLCRDVKDNYLLSLAILCPSSVTRGKLSGICNAFLLQADKLSRYR